MNFVCQQIWLLPNTLQLVDRAESLIQIVILLPQSFGILAQLGSSLADSTLRRSPGQSCATSSPIPSDTSRASEQSRCVWDSSGRLDMTLLCAGFEELGYVGLHKLGYVGCEMLGASAFGVWFHTQLAVSDSLDE